MEVQRISQSVSAVLRQERHQRGWTQLQLANEVGTTEVSVSRWERGDIIPGPYFREKLAELFGKSTVELGFSPRPEKMRRERVCYDPQIPPPVSHFVGREQVIAHIKTRLEGVVALSGLPGVGKTALVAQLAHDEDVRKLYDGILWVHLGPQPDLLKILERWGTLLGLKDSGASPEDWYTALREKIYARRILFVLDDSWQNEDSLLLRIGGPACAYLVTTRFPALAYLFDRDTVRIEELAPSSGLALLEHLTPEFVAEEQRSAEGLVRCVGGLPLGLTLMGTYLRIEMQQGNNRRIGAAMRLLQDRTRRFTLTQPQALFTTYPSDTEGRSLSLQSVIAPSINHLSQEARCALQNLSHFPPKPNSFSEEAALAVANCSGTVLDQLTDAGLLEVQGTRYSIHATIADSFLIQQSEDADVQRFVSYFLRLVEEHPDESVLSQEFANILSAFSTAYERNLFLPLIALATTFFSSHAGRELYVQEAKRRILSLEFAASPELEKQGSAGRAVWSLLPLL